MHSPHPASGAAFELALTDELSGRAPSTMDAPRTLVFEDVYEQNYRFVWRVLRALGLPPAAVEDVVQDVFVIVHRRLPEFEGRSSVRTWLFRIASWVVANERRRTRTKPAHEPIDDAVRDGAPGPFEMTARSQALRALELILSRMDEEKRIVFVLMDIEEMKAIEVADVLQINVNTVYSRLRLAREQFRRLLGESGASPERNER